MTPCTVAHHTPLSMGFSRKECWNGLPCTAPGDLPDPGIKPVFLCFLHWQVGSFPTSATWEAFISVQSLSHVRLFATPWTLAHQAALSITSSWSLLKLMSIASVLPSNHLTLCHPFLLLPSIFLSIRVFSKKSVLHIRWQNIGISASASVLPMNIQD